MTPHLAIDVSRRARRMMIGKEIGNGAEGRIYEDSARPDLVVKVVKKPDPALGPKLAAMLESPPEHDVAVADGGKRLVQIAWPKEIVTDSRGEAIGFSMARVDMAHADSLYSWFFKGDRRGKGLSDDRRVRVHIAQNFASVVGYVHRRGHNVVDFKPQNAMVHRPSGLVCLLDCNGYSIRGADRVHPAALATPEHVAPEFFLPGGGDPKGLGREQDLFGLAVMLFRLLDDGTHPASASNGPQWLNDSATNYLAERMFFIDPRCGLKPPAASRHHLFPPDLRAAFLAAFTGPPGSRPTAAQWAATLERAAARMVPCAVDGRHWHFGLGCLDCQPSRRPLPSGSGRAGAAWLGNATAGGGRAGSSWKGTAGGSGGAHTGGRGAGPGLALFGFQGLLARTAALAGYPLPLVRGRPPPPGRSAPYPGTPVGAPTGAMPPKSGSLGRIPAWSALAAIAVAVIWFANLPDRRPPPPPSSIGPPAVPRAPFEPVPKPPPPLSSGGRPEAPRAPGVGGGGQSPEGGVAPAPAGPLLPVAAPGRPGWTRDQTGGCHVWNANPQPGQTVRWSGACSGGMASGYGTADWRSPTTSLRMMGTLAAGRTVGQVQVIMTLPNGLQFVGASGGNDEAGGRGTLTFPDRTRITGHFRGVLAGAAEVVGVAQVIAPGFRYQGELDRKLRPHGRGVFFAGNGPLITAVWTHGCALFNGQVVRVARDNSECPY